MSIDILDVRNIVAAGIKVRLGETVTAELAQERANNIATALLGLLDEGCPGCLDRGLGARPQSNPGDVIDEPASRYFFDKGSDK